MTAKEESVVYAIPIAIFRPFVANNTAVLNYLLRIFAINPALKTMKIHVEV
jgi:CBS domain-containing protein